MGEMLSTQEELEMIARELKQHFSPEELEKMARKVGFVQRESKCRAEDFVSLCVFLKDDLSAESLTRLCSELEASNQVSMSTEGLNQRFNSKAVAFLETFFSSLLQKKLRSSASLPCDLDTLFHRIRILDSTVFQTPDQYADRYQGSGGSSHTAGMKIQLEYELKSGEFMQVDLGAGKNSDGLYGTERVKTVEENDLCIRDLGYFCIEDFEEMDNRGAYYVSRLKPNIRVYEKSEMVKRFKNGKVKKDSLYKKVDLEDHMNRLQTGEIIELPDVYLGKDKKHQTRLLMYKLDEEQTKQRLATRAKNEKKKGITYNDKTKRLSSINLYITNIPEEYVKQESIYDLYALRWQIEILFKTWKSIFHIDQCDKPVKTERLECHVYGQLIAIFLCSSLMFQMRSLLLVKKKKETSELKTIGMIKDFIPILQQALQKKAQDVEQVLTRLFKMIRKNGYKSRRYKKKTVFDILGVYNDTQNFGAVKQ